MPILLAVSTREGELYLVEAESLEKFYKHTKESSLIYLVEKLVNKNKIDEVVPANYLHKHIYSKSIVIRRELLQKYLELVREGRGKEITTTMIDLWEKKFMSKLKA